MRSRKQKIFLIAKILIGIFILALIALYAFRDALLQSAITKVSQKMRTDYNSDFTIKNAQFNGLTSVEIQEVILVPKDADTLLKIERLNTKVNFWHLFAGIIQIENLEAKNGFIQLVKTKNGRNFDAFLPKKKDTIDTGEKPNYAKLVYNLLNKTLNLVPTNMHIENMTLRMDDMGKKAKMDLKSLQLVDKQLDTKIRVQTNTFTQNWRIKGFADPRNKQSDIRFFNLDTGKIKVPYFDERYGLKASFDSIHLKVDKIDMSGGELHVDGFTSIVNFTVNHPKIATKDVVIKNARFDYNFLFGKNFIAVDSSSTLILNKIKFKPFVSYNNENDIIYTLKVDIPKMKAQDFIVSLPEGLFTHFVGMEAEGTFNYQLDFVYNKDKPNKLIFDSKLSKENLKIIKYGEANLNKINGTFMYRANINNVLQRPILVGPENPMYSPLSEISPFLQKAVLTTEDPSFFSHHGFINEAFKQSIVKNIKTKKFTRGASTISMQLVKNVFLTRDKTLSRKLEEILLVYILENNRIVSKSRMLEVYFNIIEWGPNIYGIGEASQFYFQKSPSQLTLNECLFLANIIPSPRKFMYQFNTEGNLKPFAVKRDKNLINLMMRRGVIVPNDTTYQMPIYVSGAATNFIKVTVKDTLQAEENVLEEFDF